MQLISNPSFIRNSIIYPTFLLFIIWGFMRRHEQLLNIAVGVKGLFWPKNSSSSVLAKFTNKYMMVKICFTIQWCMNGVSDLVEAVHSPQRLRGLLLSVVRVHRAYKVKKTLNHIFSNKLNRNHKITRKVLDIFVR